MKLNLNTSTKYVFSSLALLLFLANAPLVARDILGQRINVALYNAPLENALQDIAHLGQFQWSYNAAILDKNKTVSYHGQQQTVKAVLREILGTAYTVKQSGDYLILKKVKKPEQRISGYLSDQKTGKGIPNATIYDPATLKSTVTDQDGFYELSVVPQSSLVVATLDYKDTVIQVQSIAPQLLRIEMIPDSAGRKKERGPALQSIQREVYRVPGYMSAMFGLAKQRYNNLNTGHDSLSRAFQASLLPNIGTNHVMSGSVTNRFSLNVIAGYSKALNGVEIGGVLNMNRQHVRGVQVAGAHNQVGGGVYGVQIGGASNYVGQYMRGVQIGGAANLVGGRVEGAQIAGAFNHVEGGLSGLQMSGAVNIVDSTLVGTQIGGAANVVTGDVKGWQIGGAANVVMGNVKGWQIGGAANTTLGNTTGVQIAGASNVTDTLDGTQIAGFFNRAKYLNGVQIGVVNTAHTVKGIQLGIFNFSKDGGYVTVEAASNEVHTGNFLLKTGTARLYTILTAGTDVAYKDEGETERLWSTGMGLGTYLRAEKQLGVTVDLIHRHVNLGKYNSATQEWEQVATALNLRLGKHWHLAAGPSANLLIARSVAVQNAVLPEGLPQSGFNDRANLHFWLGGSIGLRYQW